MLQPPERTVGGRGRRGGGGAVPLCEPIDVRMLEGGGRHGQAAPVVMVSGVGAEVMAGGQRAAGLRAGVWPAHAGMVPP